jgi:MFS family permease
MRPLLAEAISISMDPIEAAEDLSRCRCAHELPEPAKAVSFQQTFRALEHRNFRLFFVGQLISLIGTWMNNTAEGWLVYQLTGSKALLGIVAAASTAPMLLLSTWGGWLADRRPKRSILVVTQAVSMLVSLTLAFLVWRGSVQTWQLILLAVVGGVIMAFDMPARQSFVIEMTDRKDLVNAISLNSAAFNGARIIGPSVAGVVMAQVGIAMCFFLDSVSFIAVIVGLMMMKLAPIETPTSEESLFAGSANGFRYVWNTPRLRRIFFLFSVAGIFGWSYSVLMPAIAKDVLKSGAASYGLLLASNGFGALCGAITVAAVSHRYPSRTLALGGIWFFSATIIGFAFTHHLWLAMIFLAGAGFGMLLFFASTNSAVQTSVRDDMRGRVMGIWALAFGGTVPLGALVAGTAGHFLGPTPTISIGAVICALAALAIFTRTRPSTSEQSFRPNS